MKNTPAPGFGRGFLYEGLASPSERKLGPQSRLGHEEGAERRREKGECGHGRRLPQSSKEVAWIQLHNHNKGNSLIWTNAVCWTSSGFWWRMPSRESYYRRVHGGKNQRRTRNFVEKSSKSTIVDIFKSSNASKKKDTGLTLASKRWKLYCAGIVPAVMKDNIFCLFPFQLLPELETVVFSGNAIHGE